MSSKTHRSVLITGGTSGLGYECALNIAKSHPDLTVVIAARSDPNGCAEQINKSLGQTNVHFMRMDLSNLANVRSFAGEWQRRQHSPIQALLLNAALQFPGDIEYSDDGFEKTFAIGHIGHALLFSLLRPFLADTARIVITSSGVHDPEQMSGMPPATYVSAEELAHPSPASANGPGRKRYCDTKLANILYGYALHNRFKTINERQGKSWTVTIMDPGLIPGSGLARDYSPFFRFIWFKILPKMLPILRALISPNIHSASESAEALARLAVGSDVEGESGMYFEGQKVIQSSKDSHDEAKQEDLWQWTVKTLAQSEEEAKMFDLADLS